MNRHPVLRTTLAFCTWATVQGAFAQPNGPSPERIASALDPVIVSANRDSTRIDQALAESTLITRSDIESAGVRSLSQLLATQPGLQQWSNGGPCQSSSVSIRGLDPRHVLLLIDGVRYGSATAGAPVYESLDLDSIERIEIVRGPLSSLYGSDAVGGVIHIITREGREGLHGAIDGGIGSHATKALGAGIQFGNERVDGSVRVSHLGTRGISATTPEVSFGNFNPDRDGCHRNGVSARIGWNPAGRGRDAQDWRIDGGVLDSRGMVRFDDGPGADARARTHAQIIHLQAAGPVVGDWRTTLRAARTRDAYDTIESASAFDLGLIATTQTQLSWENRIGTPVGNAMLILDHNHQQVEKAGTPYSEGERNLRGVGVALDGAAGAHHWQASLRRDSNSQFGGETTGAVAYGHDITQALRLGASYGTSFVAPSFNQLYYPGYGNPLLQPERGRHLELNARWRIARHRIRLAWFDNRIRGYITAGPTPANLPNARIKGWSISDQTRVGDWVVEASADLIDGRNTSGAAAVTGKELPRRARRSLRIAADREFGAWSAGAVFTAFSGRYDDTRNTVRLGGYATTDLRAQWRATPEWRFGLNLNNIFDKRYETARGYAPYGRTLFVSAHFRPGGD